MNEDIKGIVKKIKEIGPYTTKKSGKVMQTCGILVGDTWVNIREFSKEAAELKLKGVVEGQEYLVSIDPKWGNVVSFVPAEDAFDADPELKKKTDEQLARDAPSESLKEVVHQEGSGSVGTPATYLDRESRRQTMIVRQSALNYATQLESAFLTWELQAIKGLKESVSPAMCTELFENSKKRIKATAKEFEDNVMRVEK